MRCIYVAGPYRAPTRWKIELNIREAEETGLIIAKLGAVPVIPHSMTRNFDDELLDQYWLDATLEILKRCDALMLSTDRWQQSEGTQGEVAWCSQHNVSVLHTVKELENWVIKNPT